MNLRTIIRLTCLAFLFAMGGLLDAGSPKDGKDSLQVVLTQKDFLALEPLLVTVRAGDKGQALPAEVGKGLRFDIKPAVKPRPGAKPLPQEAKTSDSPAPTRLYDLLEWYQFPEGTFTVQAVLEVNGSRALSAPVTLTIRRPAKDDAEWGPVDRLHHIPWGNYCHDQFCGDTFDVVKRWPQSKLTPYCHYWNGVFSQNKKEYDKAIASFQTVMEKHPSFALAQDAEIGMIECLAVQKKAEGARRLAEMRTRLEKSGSSAARDTIRQRIASLDAQLKGSE